MTRTHNLLASLYCCLLVCVTASASAALVVPSEVQMPGTQPEEVATFASPDTCAFCHAGYDMLVPENEPVTGWRGAAMGNAARDPIFWATVAVAENDFDGAGDLCLRCHSTAGWYGGRSTPTDGSGLLDSDDNGVECDTCHIMTNPDDSEYLGVMNLPFIANCSDDPVDPLGTCQSETEGYYGSGMLSLWSGSDKLGPYSDTAPPHAFLQSAFHRSVDFCGSCHDVSNPLVGDLAPNHGTQSGAPVVVADGTLDAPGDPSPNPGKAAFNNPPYAYGIAERTFSEYKSSVFPTTPVSEFNNLPADLKVAGGSLEVTYQAALQAGTGGDYEDGTTRFFSCQSCHMRPVTGTGCNNGSAPMRSDLPKHDQTGGNYWFANMTQYQDTRGTLRFGGGLIDNQRLALDLGQQRAVTHLSQAASLTVNGNSLKIVNLTGHKLITGFPEGRRMWLNIKWYNSNNAMLREDGAYGPIGVSVPNPAGGPDVQVESLLDLHDPNTKIYEAHYAMTREWAAKLLSAGLPANLALSFDRTTGNPDFTLGDLAAQPDGSYHETFHFALNDYVASDNRIPPYGMSYDIAKRRNTLPVPESQYGDPGAGGTYNYWDDFSLNPPNGAIYATIDLVYQGTSWEYIQFLWKANTGQNAFLGQEGVNMLDAWINAEVPVAMEFAGDRKMVPPVIMASTTWGTPPTGGCDLEDDTDCDGVPNSTDNCPLVSNADQSDFDLDGAGDQCDTDDDDDTIADTADHCPRTSPGDAVDPDGCSSQQRLDANCPSKGAYRNHGKYVKCFVKETCAQTSLGLITKKQKKVIVSPAAKSHIGKKKGLYGRLTGPTRARAVNSRSLQRLASPDFRSAK
ncbi:MAG: thrombospondin type 3 repeat-containing protein [Gammaproteobacteria bacterium]